MGEVREDVVPYGEVEVGGEGEAEEGGQAGLLGEADVDVCL